MLIPPEASANERALYDLADRTNAPGYSIDPMLLASLNAGKDKENMQNIYDAANKARAAKETPVVQKPALLSAPSASLVASGGTLGGTLGGIDIMGNLDDQIKKLREQAGDDPDKLAAGFANIETAIAAKKADLYKEAQTYVHTKYGIPTLEAQLAQQEANDKAHPLWLKYKTDSDETAAARAKVMAARNAADGGIREKLLGDTVYQSLEAKTSVLGKVAGSIVQGSMNWNEKKDREAAEFVTSLGPEGEKNMKILLPQDFQDNPRGIFSYIKGRNQKEANDILTALKAAPDEIPKMALSGSLSARKILNAKEHEATGGKSKALLDAGYGIADNSKLAMEAFETMRKAGLYSGVDDKVLNNTKSFLGPVLLDAKDEHKAQAAKERQDIAIKYMKWQNIKTFNSDVSQIPSDAATPAFLMKALADPLVNTNGKISIDQAKVLARQAPDIPTAQAQINELATWYDLGAKKYSKSALFAIPVFEVEKLKTEAAMSKLERFFNRPNPAVEAVGGIANDIGLAIGANVRLPFEYFGSPESQGLGESMTQAIKKTQERKPLLGGNK